MTVISFHHGVNDVVGMFMALGGEMEIDHGGVEAAVAEILLDAPDVDAGLQKMGGIAVPEGMNGDAFCEVKLFHNASERALNRGIAHGFLGGWPLVATATESGEYPGGISMG